MAIIFVHGGHTTFLGMLGLRFSSDGCEDGSEQLRKLQEKMLEASDDEPDAALKAKLVEGATNLPLEMDGEGAIAVSALLPLIWHLERRAERETGTCSPTVPETFTGRSPLSTEHLGITLFLVRHFFPGIPVAVVS